MQDLPTPPQDGAFVQYQPKANNLPPTPPPDIIAAFAILNLEPARFPSADQCLAHLKFLEALYLLREDIIQRDGLFGIWDEWADRWDTSDKTFAMIHEKRWEIYVAKAVQRFEKWWTVCIEKTAKRLEYKDIPDTFQKFEDDQNEKVTAALPFTDLPPLGTTSISALE